MPDFEAPVRVLDSEAQRRCACDLAELVAPYGTLDSDVVDPAAFVALQSRLNLDATTIEVRAIGDECKAIIDRFEEEPDGPAFYTFGAVVALYYASHALRGEPQAAVDCAKRFLDLLGSGDDDGESGLFGAAVSYLARPSQDERCSLLARIEAHADSMR